MPVYKLIITEKPSAARAIAAALGANVRGDGCIHGGGFIVSWCCGISIISINSLRLFLNDIEHMVRGLVANYTPVAEASVLPPSANARPRD